MKKIFIICFVFLVTFSIAQKEKVQLYIDIYKDIAINEMQRTGVPASITLAQGILESKFGQSDLSLKSNNHFGIKCKLDWNGEKVYSDDDEKQECFRKYTTPQESYIDHSNFLKSRSHYAWLFNLDPTDYQSWAKGLKKSGYATETDYAEKLIGLIQEYNLNQYSLLALNKKNNESNFNSSSLKNNHPKLTTTIVADDLDEIESTVSSNTNKNDASKDVAYPENIFEINSTKVLFVKKGKSLLALANEQNITLNKIYEINEMEEVDILESDKLIYLEKKSKKGNKDFHIVQKNETLHDIAQKEGVRLTAIEEYNSINRKLNPLVGEKIYLRSKALTVPKMTSQTAQTLTTKNNSTK